MMVPRAMMCCAPWHASAPALGTAIGSAPLHAFSGLTAFSTPTGVQPAHSGRSSTTSALAIPLAPNIYRGEAAIPAGSVKYLGPLAQGLPLLSIVTAQDGGAALLKTPYFRQRPHKHLRAQGIARNNVSVERGANADRIGGKQELATAV